MTPDKPEAQVKPQTQLSNQLSSLASAIMDDTSMTMDGSAGMGGVVVITENLPVAVIDVKPEVR